MKEYTIICIYNGGIPFALKKFNNIQEAKNKIYEMVQLEEERNRIYYVNNDFFENKHSLVSNSKYLCIKVRDVLVIYNRHI